MSWLVFSGTPGERSEHRSAELSEASMEASAEGAAYAHHSERVVPITEQQQDELSRRIFTDAMGAAVLIFPSDEPAAA